MERVPRISEAEWVVMKVVWNRHPISANEIIESLDAHSEWNPKTIRTLVTRLVKKGALSAEKEDRLLVYRPLVDEHSCIASESRSFLHRFFGGSLNPMMASLFETQPPSREELDQLESLLEDLRGRGNRKGGKR